MLASCGFATCNESLLIVVMTLSRVKLMRKLAFDSEVLSLSVKLLGAAACSRVV